MSDTTTTTAHAAKGEFYSSTETTTEWGVRWGKGASDVRWDPTYRGARPQEPYTEAEARADAKRNGGLPVVKRTRIVVTTEFEGAWEDVQ